MKKQFLLLQILLLVSAAKDISAISEHVEKKEVGKKSVRRKPTPYDASPVSECVEGKEGKKRVWRNPTPYDASTVRMSLQRDPRSHGLFLVESTKKDIYGLRSSLGNAYLDKRKAYRRKERVTAENGSSITFISFLTGSQVPATSQGGVRITVLPSPLKEKHFRYNESAIILEPMVSRFKAKDPQPTPKKKQKNNVNSTSYAQGVPPFDSILKGTQVIDWD